MVPGHRSGRTLAMLSLRVVCLFAAILVAALATARAQDGLAELRVAAGEPATLTIWNRPIVTFRAQVDSLTPALRVEAAADRIADLELADLDETARYVPGSLGPLEGYFIQLGNQNLFGILPQDLDPEAGQTLAQVAQTAARQLTDAMHARVEQQRLPVLLRGLGLALAASLVFGLALFGIERLRRRALARIEALSHGRKITLRGIDIRPYLRVSAGTGIRAIAAGLQLVALYLWLGFTLLLFPYSQPWGEQLARWFTGLLAELGGGALRAIPGLFTVTVIFVVTRIVAQLVDRFFLSIEAGWLRFDWIEAETAKATRRLVVVVIWVFALVVAYPYIPGSQTAAFQGISVLLGLMVSLGAAGFVNQVMSGLVIAYARSIRTGEFVQVGSTQGTVTEVGVLATKLRTPTLQEITIPNAVLVGSVLTNFSRHADPVHGSIIATTVTIGYDAPWRQVEAMLLIAAERTRDIRHDPAPRVLQRALGDFYVDYQLVFAIDQPAGQVVVLSDLHRHIQDVFNENGVQIMSPHFDRQPQEPVIVPQSAWFTPPAVPPAQPIGTEQQPRPADPTRGTSSHPTPLSRKPA